MRNLNEFVARQANKDNGCKCRFWEGRFKPQALLDEKVLLACMVYGDLNPIRVNMAHSVEATEFTSAYERVHGKVCAYTLIQTQSDMSSDSGLKSSEIIKKLLGFVGSETHKQPKGNPFYLLDYLELLDFSGKIIHPNKRG